MTPYARHIARLEQVPPELHDLPIWCAWELVRNPKKAKPDKVPVSPITGQWKGSQQPGFCTTAERAIHYAEAHKHLNGIGIILNPALGIAGGDLDWCRDITTGEPSAQAAAILEAADTYAEISPGVAGYRFFFRGSFGGHTGNNRAKGVEFYEDGRFLTFTGMQEEGTPFAIERRDLSELGRAYFSEKASKAGKAAAPDDFVRVNLDTIKMTDYTRRLILEGVEGDRSVAVFGVCKDLVRAGCDDATICRILADPQNGLAEAALDRRGNVPSAMRWIAEHNIPKARAEVAKETADISGLLNSPTDEPFSLAMFALNGKSTDMEKQMLDDKFILGKLAILGQATVFYASRNAGKTLITLRMLIDAIEAGNVEPQHVFYINADDNFKGLVTKLKISERYGFHMLAPTHMGFQAEMLTAYMAKMIEAGTARGCIIILDTLKKFADVMDKKRGSEFGKDLRQFVMHGGTVIALAHVNKHRDSEGKVIFSGTSDIPDDVDAVYTADVIEDNAGTRTVLFENQKNRGDNAATASYSYTKIEGTTYQQLLDSVRSVSEAEAEEARKAKEVAERLAANRTVIQAITDAIAEGVIHRTELIAAVKESTGESANRVTKVLDEHTGESLMLGHRWTCERGEKNARIYHRLNLVFGGKLENRPGYEKHGKFEKLNVIDAAA